MRKNTKTTSFFKQKSYMLASVLMLMAVFGMTGVYLSEERAEKKQQEQLVLEEQQQQEQLALEEQQEKLAKAQETEEDIFVADNSMLVQNDDFLDDPEVVSGSQEEVEVEPQKEAEGAETKEDVEETLEETEQKGQAEEVQETASGQVQQELHFDALNEMGWPLQGNVIMNYSMEQTVYFATLDQYKYNPALIIQGNVNDKVLSVADGKITQIETSEETGCTVTVELGDGYSAVYGQLKEVPFAVEDYVKAGETIGYISEPTKYYSVEGTNLYFQMTKDGVSVDPMEFLQ